MKQYVLSRLRFPRAVTSVKWLTALVAVLVLTRMAVPVYAGGGGENMLLIVNPNDEPSLRIANAYVQARHIPVNNILYIVPPSNPGGAYLLSITTAQFQSAYQSAIPATIAARGIAKQIDYIGTIGQPQIVNGYCFEQALNELTQMQNGVSTDSAGARLSELFYAQRIYQGNPGFGSDFIYTRGSNPAIHHSTKYPPVNVGTTGTANYAQWYMCGIIGYSGINGLTPTDMIQKLRRTVAADGSKPGGTMYFEKSYDVRSQNRFPFWAAVQEYMTANGIPWIQESLSGGYVPTPVNRRDVMGSEIGSAGYSAPNGSIYLPGSWADNLTSFGAGYSFASQTLGNNLILSGAGGSSGTVAEPGGLQSGFPMCSLNVYSQDGSTLGEAFYKSVAGSSLIQFQGDLLSQAYADVPSVSFLSAPANGATVSGTVVISGSAFLPNLTSNSTATGIASIALFVDGVNTGAFVTGASGSFNLDTTTLTDGVHEVRLVAYNNSQAASEGCAINNYVVNNLGQSVTIPGVGNYLVSSIGIVSIPVTAVQGSGPAITGIQLQALGRTVGAISGLSGTVAVSGTSLAYNDNPVTPVAILSGGQQVAGQPVTVSRAFQPMPGAPPTPSAQRTPGFDISFYPGAATKSIATTDFSGAPATTIHSNSMALNPATSPPTNMPVAYLRTWGGSNFGLAVMGKSSFIVTQPGEYAFSFALSAGWTSCGIAIDGVMIGGYDRWSGSTLTAVGTANTQYMAYLQSGEHTLTLKLATLPSGTTGVDSNFALWYRGPDSNLRSGLKNLSINATAPYFYTVTKNVGH